MSRDASYEFCKNRYHFTKILSRKFRFLTKVFYHENLETYASQLLVRVSVRVNLTKVLPLELPLFRSVIGVRSVAVYVSVPPSSKMAGVFWNLAVVFASESVTCSLLSVVYTSNIPRYTWW